jgi:hypothetical protein
MFDYPIIILINPDIWMTTSCRWAVGKIDVRITAAVILPDDVSIAIAISGDFRIGLVRRTECRR